MRKILLVMVAVTVLASSTSAAVIGPWPIPGATDPYHLWQNQPIPGYTSGTVTIVTPPATGTLNMAVFTGGTKTSWLPYGGTYAEKMTIAQLVLPTGPFTGVHARVYDPLTGTGKSGWAVILKDSNGKILDFGIRGFFASKQIKSHEYDGVGTWVYGPTLTRTLTGNNYYTMDFGLLGDGRISYYFQAYENGNTWNYYGVTTTTYADISQVYLNVMTPDTSGAATYKWTEFAVPEPSSMLALATGAAGLMGFAIRRRRV